MKTGMVRLLPEEEELGRKREELALLQAQLAERELDLANMRAELATFERLYLRKVGVLYAELDEWNARTAELLARQQDALEFRTAAQDARARADESHAAVDGEIAESKEFSPTAELKRLYREVAKQVHPDLAIDDADRRERENLMKAANAAYLLGDAYGLRRILEEYHASPESVRDNGIGADLIRVVRQLKQVKKRLSEIEVEFATLVDSEIAKLKAKAEHAHSFGRDLLSEMAAAVMAQIRVAEQRYEIEAARMRPAR